MTSRVGSLLCAMLLVVVPVSQGHARTFSRCQLTKELIRYNFPRTLVPQWVCLVEYASSRSTDRVTDHRNGYASYGLFQINNKDWCKKSRKGGYCNMKCEDFINQDLSDDVRCAKRIFGRVGFKGWPNAYTHCKDAALPDLSKC